jgi:hypothetical protein
MTYKTYAKRLSKPPIDKLLKSGREDLVKETTSRGWNRFREGIEDNKISETSGIIFVNDAVVSGERFTGTKLTATNKQIGGWLHYGTPEHGPKKAKVLSWVSGGVRIFAKKVKGIKATNWWGLKPDMVAKLNKIAKGWLKISKNG